MEDLTNEEILHCPQCGEVMLRQEPGFWKCPRCDGEWWPPEEDEDDQQILACFWEDVRRPLLKHGGGGHNGRKKHKPYKPLPSERFLLI